MSNAANEPSGAGMSDEIRTYLKVFATLGALTAMTVGVAYMDLPQSMAVIIALLIAVTKASLIGAFFMHLRHEGKFIKFSIGICLMLVMVLLLLVVPDIGVLEEEIRSSQAREIAAHEHYSGLAAQAAGHGEGH
ncbi:MAG: cytochrome C oxidase subunit IV family protein [Deltaproteobacteria bacterium]